MVPCAGRLWAEAQVPEGLAPDADPSYINELTAKAKELKLHESRMWTVLLHYRSKRFGGVESDADGPRFFLTPNMKGKTDPQAEMDGTLRAFFQPVGENPNVHPQCLFPARYEWLKNTLQFDPKRLPDRACPILHVWFDHINAESVSIMFASFFMSAPASMFGHTLIKLNTKRQGAVREHELLNFALNFAADPGGLDPVRYVLYGLFGGFPGYFALLPYHIKVREYNDIENRDMWEYHLSLTPDEIRRMFYHAWELQSTHFDYFYMDENCSFHLLSLLEVARPTLQLTDGFWFWVIPGETIKRVLAQPGLVTQVKYRPSLFSEIVQRVGALTPEEKEMLYTVIAGGKADLAPGTSPDKDARTAEILDTALMILRFRSEPEKMDAVDRTHYRELLRARTELPPAPVRDPGEPVATRPDQGHNIRMVSLAGGSASVGGAPVGFTQITLRPHYHDSMSPDIGFAPHSEFLFLDTTIRAYASGEVTLERFHFLRIASQVPIDRISRSTSYIIDIGAETAPAVINKTREERYDYAKLSAFTSGDLFLMYRTFTAVDAARRAHQWDNMLTRGVTTFYGLATDAGGSNGPEWLFTAMPGVRYEYAEAIAGNVRAGPAFHLGAMFTYGRLRMELAGEYFGYSVMRQDDDYTGVFKTRFTLAKNHEIRLEARTRRQPGTHRGRSDVALSYLYFY